MCQTVSRTPDDTSRSTMRASAGFDTAKRQCGHRNAYEPWLLVEQTCTLTSRVVSSTSPHVGQLARMVATWISLRTLRCSIGSYSVPVEREADALFVCLPPVPTIRRGNRSCLPRI